MYANVMVAVDNSEWSNRAAAAAAALARATSARLTGVHAYAARLHDRRFRDVEPGLPERYRSEEQLERQRAVHADLIGRGLRVISDSYLDAFERTCRGAGVACARKALEGCHYEVLASDARGSGYDLVAIGAHGLGHTPRAVIGGVCERVLRLVTCDVLVVRDPAPPGAGRVVVAVDGSADAFGALGIALELCGALGGEPSAVAAYDPFFHGAAFRSLAGVLSPEASRLFRFEEQERLHAEIVDRGLSEIYRGHAEEARARAAAAGFAIPAEVLEGKPFEAILSHVERVRPALLVVGRSGIHRAAATIGTTAENLVRLAPCNVLVVNTPADATLRGEAPGALTWTADAEARLARVPSFVRGMVRRRIEGFARERGHAEVTVEVVDAVRSRSGR